jgi:regulator of protease activity HflC (stomatin/prohibitin superfamily)
VHVAWQDRYDSDLVRPVTRGVIRDAVSQFGIEEVYSTKRGELVEIISQELTNSFGNNGIIMYEFVLRNISFSDEYAASVEQKQIAEQLAQQAAFVVQQREFEADQARAVAEGERDAAILAAEGAAEARLLEADAEAKALQLINDVIIQNPDLINYMYLQKIAPNVQVIFLPAEAPYLFDLGGLATDENGDLPALTLPSTGSDGN